MHIEKNDNIKRKIVCAVILGIVVVAYNLLYLNRTMPITDGWHKYYVELIKSGCFPYRDFYYYLPPLNLLTDYALWSLSGDYFLIYRLWRLFERVVMMELLYCILSRKFSAENSCLACSIGAVLGTACVYDLNGDYNQTEVVLFVALGFATYRYFDAQSEKSKRLYMFFAGIIAGLMFLLKQSTFVGAGIIFVLVFLILCYIQKEKKHYIYLGYVVLGCALPIIICFAILLYNHALSEFFFQVFGDTSSKGSLFDILVGAQINIFRENIYQILLAILIVVYMYYKKNFNKIVISKRKINALLFGIVFLLSYLYFDECVNFFSLEIKPFGWLLLALSFIPIFLYMIYGSKEGMSDIFFYILSVIMVGIILVNNVQGVAEIIHNEESLFESIVYIITLFYYILLVLIVANLLSILIKKESLISEQMLMMCCIGVADGYAISMTFSSTTAIIGARGAFIIAPICICILMNLLQEKTKRVFVVGCLFLCLICIAQKSINAYSWWGSNTGNLNEKVFTVDSQALKGFKFTVDEARMYDEVVKLIEYNSTEDSVVYGFPHVKIFNILTDRYKMNGFVPVPFYDVCTDKFAREEAIYLAMNNPDIIIWCDIPGCLETHENLFRGGEKLGQRDIQSWFAVVKEESYELIGQVGNLYVYKLKNDIPTKYTYFENPGKENTTAKTDLTTKIFTDDVTRLSFEGDGTLNKPYLIQSLEDLIEFREYVNAGNSFKNKYFKQTVDIEWIKGEEWIPIGIMESGNYFAGIYDGAGNSINNIVVNSQYENVGFFGQLEGTVMNLSLINVSISGVCCGGITSHGYGSPLIINCYVSGDVMATHRAGGIADNFCGRIINSVSDCTLMAPNTGDIVSYGAVEIENCFGLRQYEDKSDIVKKLNTNIQVMMDNVDGVTYSLWDIDDEGITLVLEKYVAKIPYSYVYIILCIVSLSILFKNTKAKNRSIN